jgi:hypothetical protein
MKSYLLFILGVFDTQQEIEYFTMNVFGDSLIVDNIKCVIGSTPNLILIFDSEIDRSEIIKLLPEYLTNEYVKFYFLFPLDSMITVYLPEQLKDIIFKPSGEVTIVRLEKIPSQLFEPNLDEILDKIKNFGIDSLTIEEKNFLDNFEN